MIPLNRVYKYLWLYYEEIVFSINKSQILINFFNKIKHTKCTSPSILKIIYKTIQQNKIEHTHGVLVISLFSVKNVTCSLKKMQSAA